MVAGEGFEPPTSGLWARRATGLLYPAISALFRALIYITINRGFVQPQSLFAGKNTPGKFWENEIEKSKIGRDDDTSDDRKLR